MRYVYILDTAQRPVVGTTDDLSTCDRDALHSFYAFSDPAKANAFEAALRRGPNPASAHQQLWPDATLSA